MSEARCRADHGDDLSDRDDDGAAVLEHLDVIGRHDIDRSDDGSSIDDENSHRLCRGCDLGEPRPEREFVAALLAATRLASLHCPHRRVEDYLDQIVSPVDTGEVRAGIHNAAGEGVGACLGAHTLSAVNQLEDSPGEVETPPPEQLRELLVLGSFLQPLPSRTLTKVRLDFSVRRLFHLLSRSRHRLQVRR